MSKLREHGLSDDGETNSARVRLAPGAGCGRRGEGATMGAGIIITTLALITTMLLHLPGYAADETGRFYSGGGAGELACIERLHGRAVALLPTSVGAMIRISNSSDL